MGFEIVVDVKIPQKHQAQQCGYADNRHASAEQASPSRKGLLQHVHLPIYGLQGTSIKYKRQIAFVKSHHNLK